MRPIKREKNAQLKLSYGDGFVVHSLYLISRKSSLPTSVNLLDIIGSEWTSLYCLGC